MSNLSQDILERLARGLYVLAQTDAGRNDLIENPSSLSILAMLLLQKTTTTTRGNALDAVGLLVDNMAACDKIVDAILPPLLAALKQADHSERATNVLGILVRESPKYMSTAVIPAIPTIVALLKPNAIGSNAANILTGLAREHADAVVNGGALTSLVTLLDHEVCAENALKALVRIAVSHVDAVIATGAAVPVIKLLASEELAKMAAAFVGQISQDAHRAFLVAAAGAIEPLVALCRRRSDVEAARTAAWTLGVIAEHSAAARITAREAGAIAALMTLIKRDQCDRCANTASFALCNFAKDDPDCADQVLFELVKRQVTPCSCCLKRILEPAAMQLIALAMEDAPPDRVTLRHALESFDFVNPSGLKTPFMTKARELLFALEQAHCEQLEKCGLSVDPPAEFVCPITYAVMKDPVVASDGHSYEREAIHEIIHSRNGKSPLTRETLTRVLVPNHALRQRIEAHDSEQNALVQKIFGQHTMNAWLTRRLAASEKNAAALQEQLTQVETPKKRGPGRPRKEDKGEPSSSTKPQKRKRGRPPKSHKQG